jgi:hypothetical protein
MVAILASLLSLAVAMTSYNRSTRYILLGNEESFLSTIVLFMHHGCAISISLSENLRNKLTDDLFIKLGARIMAFSMLACISVEYVFVICAIHWIVMFMWLVLAISRTGVFRCEKFVNCFALATAYSCVFINHDTGRTRYKYLFYYSVSSTLFSQLFIHMNFSPSSFS